MQAVQQNIQAKSLLFCGKSGGTIAIALHVPD
jgi:hypothetical protein